MPYELLLTDQAEQDLTRLPPHLLNIVEREMERLGANPLHLGRRAVSPPYPPGGQMYQFQHDEPDEERHFFTILFHFGQDEKTLFVTGIGHQLL
ncbi:MAG TPA: hypothetical protein VMG10_12700 [Gemmataceae bacterium]|nr:hypothetical protein [Gemmataceae bacterium]